jgi:hypothetical protein
VNVMVAADGQPSATAVTWRYECERLALSAGDTAAAIRDNAQFGCRASSDGPQMSQAPHHRPLHVATPPGALARLLQGTILFAVFAAIAATFSVWR